MKKSIPFLAALFIVFVTSCKEDKKTETSTEMSQMDRVMAMHDEVMPKMSKISTLANNFRKKLDKGEGGAIEKKAMEELQAANKSMMDWMQDFMTHFDQDEINKGKALSAEKQKLLDADEKAMIDVKNKMESSLKAAEAILDSE